MAKDSSSQLGSRLDPNLAAWIRETAGEMQISQGELVSRMQKAYVESEAMLRYPQWSAQIADVNFWARSLVNAYMAQVEHGDNADKHAREEVQKVLSRKDDLIAEQLGTIKVLREEKKALEDASRKADDLQRDLDAARAQVAKVEADARQHMDDLRATNNSLMGDKIRLEADVQRYMERVASMQAAVASYDDMRAERDAAIADAQEAQQRAVETTKQTMQAQIDAINGQLHDALVAQAAAQAEAAALRGYREDNDALHETVGAQKAKISMLEDQVTSMDARANTAEQKAVEWEEKCQGQTDEIGRLQAQVAELKSIRNMGADGQTAIEGV